MSEARPAPGSQTLARGLRALELVARANDGMTTQEIADALDVHRSIATRLLSTLADFKLVVRGSDSRFRAATGLAALASNIHTTLIGTAEPVMRELAEKVGATISLLVAEGDEAVAMAVVSPSQSSYHLAFRTGSRHPIDRAAGGIALLAAMPRRPGEAARVTEARERGYAATMGEVEPGAYGVAVPLPPVPGMPPACLNLITHRAEVAEEATPLLLRAADQVSAKLA